MDNDVEALHYFGRTSFLRGYFYLPTTAASRGVLADVCQTVGDNATTLGGAKIRGIFLEGPFFCEKYKGAQNPKYMRRLKSENLDEWQERAGGWEENRDCARTLRCR